MSAPISRSWAAGVAFLLLACGTARGQAKATSALAKDTDAIVVNYRKIIVLMNGAGALDPNRAVAYLNLGDAYLQVGKKSEAKEAFQKYLELQPNSKAAPAVQEKLKSLESPVN
jgi:tetratricopeptide (TPR) repeat protein